MTPMDTFDDSAILFLSPNQHELEIIQDAIKPRRVLIADDSETALSIIRDVKTIGIVLVDVSSSSLIQIISSVKDSSGPFPIRVIGLADEELTIVYASEGCPELTGYPRERFVNDQEISYFDIVAPEQKEALRATIEEQLAASGSYHAEYEIITAKEERKWIQVLANLVQDPHDRQTYVEGLAVDFSHYKELENIIVHQREHDPLTGLPNRFAMEMALEEDMKRKLQGNRAFISINFTPLYVASLRFGHLYVNEIIKHVGAILKGFISEHIHVFGTFENRFGLYVTRYTDREELEVLGNAVADRINKVLRFERISWGIGIIEFDWSEGPLVSDILKYALITSEHAIDYQDISSNLRFYDKALSDQVEREAHILVELTQYVAEEKSEQLYLQYQPIVGVHCNTIVGFEALARFTSSTYGVVPPNEFIAIAEKYKLIIPLGWKITAQALAFGKALSTRGFDDLKISINFSVYQLLEDQFVSTLDALVEEHDLDPSRLILEITETGVNTTYRRVNLILGELQTLGFTVAIDDFGVGYSTFARESELNVDYLKIDKLFVDRLLTPSEYESVIPDMISMVHKLGHTVIVEGVEHEEQKRYLEEFGCDLYQGFLFSKPLDCTVALGLLSSA